MALIAICLILGLSFALERIIYPVWQTLIQVFTRLVKLDRGDTEAAKITARNTCAPIASIVYWDCSVGPGTRCSRTSHRLYGGVQRINEKNLLDYLFIALAPSLGFWEQYRWRFRLSMISNAGDMSPTIVAGGMKVALSPL